MSRLERKAAIVVRKKTILDDLPHLRVVYEQDLREAVLHQRSADRIFTYLGLICTSVTTRLCLTNSGPLSERVSNYNEVAATLQQTGFARFLDGAPCVD